MSDQEPASFDLVDRPWVLARTADGQLVELSLLELFRQAHQLAGLAGEVPTQVFALTRMLLAVLHGALEGPSDLDEWEVLWNADELPRDAVERYLRQHQSRFDLLHPHTPFLQVAGLRTSKDNVSELAKLIADVPNGLPFFSTRIHPELTLSLSEAARWVVHCQAFDPAGIKSGAVGDDRVSNGRGYPIGTAWAGRLGGVLAEGTTLRETLLFNLIPRDFGGVGREHHADLPAWERSPVAAGVEEEGGRAPTGPVDLYTWQSRRIRLVVEGDRVTGVLVCNGEPITPQNKFNAEPHTAWRRSKPQEKQHGIPTYMPLEHDPSRAIWRGLAALLPGVSKQQGSEPASRTSPAVLEWISTLTEEELAPERSIRLRAIGMTYINQSSITEEIIDDALSVRPILLSQGAEQLAGCVVSCVEAAEAAARALGHLAENLARAQGGDVGGQNSEATEVAFAEVDTLFRHWVASLGPDTDPIQAKQDWHRIAYRTVKFLARQLLDTTPVSAFAGHRSGNGLVTSAHADEWFHRELRKQLNLAYADGTGQATSA